jgi:hypothetical protein
MPAITERLEYEPMEWLAGFHRFLTFKPGSPAAGYLMAMQHEKRSGLDYQRSNGSLPSHEAVASPGVLFGLRLL